MRRKPKARAQPEVFAARRDVSTRWRRAGAIVVAAVVSAAAVSLAWLALISTMTGVVVIPEGVVYPADWPRLSAAAQNNWFHAHAVPLKGIAAAEHMLQHFDLFWQQFAAVGALTLSSALVALILFSQLHRGTHPVAHATASKRPG
jgi:hypothetical protein